MGLLNSIKKSLGLVAGEFELRVQPETLHVGGEVRGAVLFRALKAINIYALHVDLLHAYPDNWGSPYQEVRDGHVLAERVSFQSQQVQEYPFCFLMEPQLAPTVGPFRWSLKARASVAGGSVVEKVMPLNVRMSPVVGVVLGILEQQFGFDFQEAGADEDGIWMMFRPKGGGVHNPYKSLELSFDEQEDVLTMWFAPRPVYPQVAQRLDHCFDAQEGSFELKLKKREHISVTGQVDHATVLRLVQSILVP